MPAPPNNASTQNQNNGGNFTSGDHRTQQLLARKQDIARQRKSLPIASVEKRLVEEVKKHNTLIIVGETGSGKTTQLPQFLFSAGFCNNGKLIGITQPRRVAAITVAKRVAEECSVELGQKVGYSIRFQDVTSSSTRIKYMTDGMLVREALLDPYLSKYNIIIVDEAHERTVHTDVLLGLLKNVQNARSEFVANQINPDSASTENSNMPDKEDKTQRNILQPCQGKRHAPLKLIIMSASLDARGFSEFFNHAKAVHIQGRQYPVEILYTEVSQPDYIDATLITIFQIHLDEECQDGYPGDILVFLTGQEEIESVERLVNEHARHLPVEKLKILTVPIYSSLPSEKQMKVFKPAPSGTRKVILATNIAETSVTIPGIKYVIDPGVVKARSYEPKTGMESLIIVPTSKAQAIQRSGRAGRERPGKCYRLYPEKEFYGLKDSTVPEIKRCNLSNVVLQLKALGIDDIIGFDFMEKPSSLAIQKSLEQLFILGALNDEYKLTEVGKKMARIPMDPMYSKALLKADEFKCLEEMLILVAMLTVESMFYFSQEKLKEATAAKKSFSSNEGDHITLVNVFRASAECLEKCKAANSKEKTIEKSLNKWCRDNFINSRSLRHAQDIHRQIKGHVQQMKLPISTCGDDMTLFQKCLTASFFLNAAIKEPDGSYRAFMSNQIVQIHPSSVIHGKKPECIIFNELVRTKRNYVRNVTRIDPSWLPEFAPQIICSREVENWSDFFIFYLMSKIFL